jgi:predicted amidophosphoribosyltransferase
MIIFCPNCHEETEGKHRLCEWCGEELKSREEEVKVDEFDDDNEDIDAIDLEEVS